MIDVPTWDYRDPFIRLHNNLILISALPITMAFQREHREFLEDFLSQHHQDRHIVVRAMDGENLANLGFLDFFQQISRSLHIEPQRITVISSTPCSGPWCWQSCHRVIFWSVDQFISKNITVRNDARLFGINIGRFSPFRHRVLQMLDHVMSSDIFMTCNYTKDEVQQFYTKVSNVSDAEIHWIENKIFDIDQNLPWTCKDNGTVPWQVACEHYSDLASHFHIEIVVETDFYTPDWFTEKTSKCLWTGKPFVLIAGPGSLQRLRDMGFQTFDAIIDESYDQEPTFHGRMQQICRQLQIIKNHEHQTDFLQQMTQRAQYNRQNWYSIKNRELSQC